MDAERRAIVARHAARYGVDDGRDVEAQLGDREGLWVIRAARFVLPAQVEREDPAARRGQLRQNGQEIFLAPGEAGNKDGGLQLADP